MTIDEIVTLIQAVSDNDLTSFEYEEGDQKLVLEKKKKENVVSVMSPAAMPSAAGMDFEVPAAGTAQESRKESLDIGSDKVVTSPLVGTFYSASSPDAEPFVKEGDSVKKGQVLGIIEAMKLMNEIESEYDGVVEAILIENEGVVEYGQPLFRIR